MKYYLPLLLLCLFTSPKASAINMEIYDYNRLLSNLNLRESTPIAYIFDKNNKASHFQVINKKPEEYLTITKELAISWINGDNKFKKDFSLDDISKYTNNNDTKKVIATMQKTKAKYKIIFFNAWFEVLNQYPKLIANKKKRLELFKSISEENNDIQIIEIELHDKMNKMSPFN